MNEPRFEPALSPDLGPDPDDAPLTPEEKAAVERQGAYLAWQTARDAEHAARLAGSPFLAP